VKENLARIKPILHGIGATGTAEAAGTAGASARPGLSESGRAPQTESEAASKKQHASPQSESAASHTASDASPQTDKRIE
jgi:putative ATPase